MKLALRSLTLLVPLLCACEKKEPAAEEAAVYGEPIGIRMEASNGVPAFEVAIAATKGIALDPLVPPLSGLLHKALRGCPAFIAAASKNPEAATQVAFVVDQGIARDVVATTEGADCVIKNMSEQALPGLGAEGKSAAPGKLRVIALLRFKGAPSAEGRTP